MTYNVRPVGIPVGYGVIRASKDPKRPHASLAQYLTPQGAFSWNVNDAREFGFISEGADMAEAEVDKLRAAGECAAVTVLTRPPDVPDEPEPETDSGKVVPYRKQENLF